LKFHIESKTELSVHIMLMMQCTRIKSDAKCVPIYCNYYWKLFANMCSFLAQCSFFTVQSVPNDLKSQGISLMVSVNDVCRLSCVTDCLFLLKKYIPDVHIQCML